MTFLDTQRLDLALTVIFRVHLRGEESIIRVFTMTQTLTNDLRLKLAELETRSRKLLSESDLQKEEDVKIQLSHKLDVKLSILYE